MTATWLLIAVRPHRVLSEHASFEAAAQAREGAGEPTIVVARWGE